ncbi:MAG: cytochrome c family protein [Pseudodesulfovibrio sp.]|uniref:Cytochrome c, class III, conserved region n=1 Tax=Pseudodesulfovibrio aespoeensis (strain ATCC 700646 / DSM 10631 / Aspo-2) TaxID=643562 RepID=E6VVB0_PSEA9|nr:MULTISPECIES: cytochrome c3 family protein [Pseudodesulfovibrio]MBU4193215.1 cytochrome c family protein [Pseudomonadota bacterium]ADU62354.1 Cytochrome c, class III, conserved region [Pseudodesulfovibrio aespoeensis Aspo-2]MBU4243149.1 cytochrome c family protein [Pseudomonadota bacterium]MBU4377688.1 cytochrome c family protein [Pseudomonadota bacterium]MBU4473982.1 cytochrome c family protein [Pseudomonadota bacterium]
MQKRFLPILILTGILFVAALIGYLIPARTKEPPVRILLDNKGGKVIFTHQAHAAMEGRACNDCHHTSAQDDQSPPACSSCHVRTFDEAFAADHQQTLDQKQCAACHHTEATIDNFSHDDHADDYAAGDCQSCHHDATVEPKPQSCDNCHGKREDIPSLKEANHTRCASCHEDLFAKGITGCAACHARKPAQAMTSSQAASQASGPALRPCADCHQEPADQLVPTTMAAFHTQCLGCHEAMKRGPYGDDACYKCHMK